MLGGVVAAAAVLEGEGQLWLEQWWVERLSGGVAVAAVAVESVSLHTVTRF